MKPSCAVLQGFLSLFLVNKNTARDWNIFLIKNFFRMNIVTFKQCVGSEYSAGIVIGPTSQT